MFLGCGSAMVSADAAHQKVLDQLPPINKGLHHFFPSPSTFVVEQFYSYCIHFPCEVVETSDSQPPGCHTTIPSSLQDKCPEFSFSQTAGRGHICSQLASQSGTPPTCDIPVSKVVQRR